MAKVDGLSLAGAKIQAEQIEQFWAEKGWKVITRIESKSGSHGVTAFIRSDMVNGYPLGWYEK